MKKIIITKEDIQGCCPYCKEHNLIETTNENGETVYHCNECECDFTEDDFKHEIYRQRISCICGGEEAEEENPINCVLTENSWGILIGEEEAQGLCTNQMPHVTEVFQDSEGIVWVNIEGYDEPMEADMLDTSDLKSIDEWLEENYGDVIATDFCYCYYPKH